MDPVDPVDPVEGKPADTHSGEVSVLAGESPQVSMIIL